MIIHLSADKSDVPFDFKVPASSLDISSDEVAYLENVEVSGKLVCLGGEYLAEGKITVLKRFACDRCLKEVEKSFSLAFKEKFSPLNEHNEDEDATFFAGDKIDLTDAVRDNILTGEPIGHLCKDDCKGLCKICGKDLNEGECNCDRFVPDPRFSVLENYKVDD